MTTALSTDLYQLTMMAGYVAAGVRGRSTFELFVRDLPARRGFLVAAGIEQAVDTIVRLRFTAEEIEYLHTVPALAGAPTTFFDALAGFRFSGDAWAVREGEVVFGQEPLVRVTGPALEAQLVETTILAILNFQTSVASKAARVVAAAGTRPVLEFGSRRAHGTDAALYAARAACIAGCAGTSNVEAGFRFGLPLAGTMAHSWVMTFPDELDAFRRFLSIYGDGATLLIDTYDTVRAAMAIVQAGLRPAAVRLDSGDLSVLSREVRRIFDAGGLTGTRILASGDLDEDRIAELCAAGAPIDAFGVGTAISTSRDVPALGGVYKLVEVERGGVMEPAVKLSAEKMTWPSAKQVWRRMREGTAGGDIVTLADEQVEGARPLLRPVIRGGVRVAPEEPVDALRAHCRASIDALPPGVRRLEEWEAYPVAFSDALRAAREKASATATRNAERGTRN